MINSVESPHVSSLSLFIVSGLGGMIFGTQLGAVAGGNDSLGQVIVDMTSFEIGLLSGVFVFGAMLGSILGSPICSKFGRKMAMIIAGCSSGIFTIIAGLLSNLPLILVCRTFCGFGVGVACVVCPLYVSENASEKLKRPISGVFQLSVTIGIVVAYTISYVLTETLDDIKPIFRVIYLSNALWPAALAVMGLIVPKSKIVLDDTEKPIISGGLGGDVETTSADLSSPLIDNQVGDGGATSGWSGLLQPAVRGEVGVGLVMGVMLALTGINAVFFYAPSIFESVGFAHIKALLSLLLSVWNVLVTIVGVILVAYIKERNLLLFGLAFNMLGLGIEAVSIQVGARWFSFVGIFITVFGFAIGPGVVFWVALTRIFSLPVRAEGCSLINLQQWTENLALGFLFPILVEKFGIVVMFWFFFGIALFCFGFLLVKMKVHAV